MAELEIGAKAPEFSLPAVTREGDTTIALADYAGKVVVLYFYPKDDTPGCTTEACSFRDLLPEFEAIGGVILGVSPDDPKSHAKFAQKFALPFPLLADPDHAVAESYGVWVEKKNYGKTYMGIDRSTFIIDKSGTIAKVFRKVKVDQHVEKVLEAVKTVATA